MKYRLVKISPLSLPARSPIEGIPLVRSVGDPEEWSAPPGFEYWIEEEQALPPFDSSTQRLRKLPDVPGDGVVIVGRHEVEDIPGEEIAARELAKATGDLQSAFSNLPSELRARFLPVRAGVRVALEEGDVEAARLVVEGIVPETEAEEQIKNAILAKFPQS